MSSLIEGYNYDIFISYRQKDNKYDGWVTEFVDNLRKELEATFKDDISVYFDINPHDGLLETHDVDASLKDKLRCLIFIPIISRTYCDPKSFAWEHEFKAFVDQASNDKYGLKIKLPNGNVSNRVLPVRIHDLDPADIKECESLLGGRLRGVEFIYQTVGVNRPLRPKEDNSQNNLNQTFYRDQINKVALAVKEIILGMINEPASSIKTDPIRNSALNVKEKTIITRLRKIFLSASVVFLIIASIFLYLKVSEDDVLEKTGSSDKRISLVILPFENLTGDTVLYGRIAQINIISNLSGYPNEMRILESESIEEFLNGNGVTNYASISPVMARLTARKLGADLYITGNVIKTDNDLVLYAQLKDTRTKNIIKSFQNHSSPDDKGYIAIFDTLSQQIGKYLLITRLQKRNIEFEKMSTTTSPVAMEYYLKGKDAYYMREFRKAVQWFKKSLEADSNFIWVMRFLTSSYRNIGNSVEYGYWRDKFQSKRNMMNDYQKLYADYQVATDLMDPQKEIFVLKQIEQIDDQPPLRRSLGTKYSELKQWDKAIVEFERAIEMYRERDMKPPAFEFYDGLLKAYHNSGQYKKEKRLIRKSERDFPKNSPDLKIRRAIIAVCEKDTVSANRWIDKYLSELNLERDMEGFAIILWRADVFARGNMPDIAEKYWKKALAMAPERLDIKSSFASFLISNERNLDEGLGLIEECLKMNPDNIVWLAVKGIGLYKKGSYQDALNALQRSWDLRKPLARYDHDLLVHLEAAKKAVEQQK